MDNRYDFVDALNADFGNRSKNVSMLSDVYGIMPAINLAIKNVKKWNKVEKKSSNFPFGLLGANGAGKSTTLNLLLGFLKPDEGVISMSNSNKTSSIQLEMVGYIPENVNLYPYLSGTENLDYFCKLSGFKYDNNKLSDFLDECGLQRNAHNKKIESYSKGMRQKVGIAIAYAKKAKIYLLDEPASGLDPVSSNELSSLLKKLSRLIIFHSYEYLK